MMHSYNYDARDFAVEMELCFIDQGHGVPPLPYAKVITQLIHETDGEALDVEIHVDSSGATVDTDMKDGMHLAQLSPKLLLYLARLSMTMDALEDGLQN